jgi:hypothetical protein
MLEFDLDLNLSPQSLLEKIIVGVIEHVHENEYQNLILKYLNSVVTILFPATDPSNSSTLSSKNFGKL